MAVRILQIAYDQGLLETRALMLRSRGYEVVSVLGNQQAMALTPEDVATFATAVVGFSATHAVRSAMVQWLKASQPSLPVVVLQFHSYEKFSAADLATLSEDPEVWLDAVARCAQSR